MPNRLANETSPYLQQHADNPVDWYPWGEEALERARNEDRPILLSIGYSACHWCHVMAHESFEDADVAAEMNRHYVNVKVDREERPDLDQIYQTAHQMLTRRGGGWPLTMILTPDGTPFFAGTYFPKLPRYGMPGFKELIARVAEAYRTQRAEVSQQNERLMQALEHTVPTSPASGTLDRTPIDEALRELTDVFDAAEGGFGGAPKFPHASELAFCLRRYALDGVQAAAEVVKVTLTKMAQGGIYDQLGGGFCRYSTDARWAIPHFEKMLYDNGPLLALYADAWLVTHDPLYEKVVRETAAWTMREMQSPVNEGGGYYSSLDADSEGEEGKYYVWPREEVQALLTVDEYAVAAPHLGFDDPPNFEGHHWNPRLARPAADIAIALGISAAECDTRIAAARHKLFLAREKRVRPGRDEKVLTSWNALMVKGMARAARVFGEPAWTHSAAAAVDFIRGTLWTDGRLLATYKDGRAHLNAYLDDHAFLLDALLELVQTELRPADLDFARSIADLLLEQFEDRAGGGFYFTSHDHERLIHRPKSGHDGSTPSGNGVAACALQRLGHLLGEPRYLEAAERAVRAFYDAARRTPSGHVSVLAALDEAAAPPRIVVLRGPAEALTAWHARVCGSYRPDTLVIAAAHGLTLPPALDKDAVESAGRVSGWVCEGVSCLPPVFELDGLEQLLSHKR